MKYSTERIKIKPPRVAVFGTSSAGPRYVRLKSGKVDRRRIPAAGRLVPFPQTGSGFEPIGIVSARVVGELMANLQKKAS